MLSRPLSRPLLTLAVALSLAAVSGCGGAQARKARHLEKGQAYLAAGNDDKARVEFQNARQIDPKDPEALYELGVIAERMGNPRQAAQFYQGAIDVGPEYIPARAGLARLYLFAGVPERTLELLKPALDKHPDDARLLTLRAAVRSRRHARGGARADRRGRGGGARRHLQIAGRAGQGASPARAIGQEHSRYGELASGTG
jgi:Tfp pilus assembly protein PilF